MLLRNHFLRSVLSGRYLPLVEPYRTNGEFHQQLINAIQKKRKVKKLPEVWDILSDGKEHDIKAIASAVGYTNVQSQGFKDALAALSNLDFVIHDKRRKTVRLAAFLFPFNDNQEGAEGDEDFEEEKHDWKLHVVAI